MVSVKRLCNASIICYDFHMCRGIYSKCQIQTSVFTVNMKYIFVEITVRGIKGL